MIIITGCSYTNLALKLIRREINLFNERCKGKVIFLDATTTSLLEYAYYIRCDDWVFIFASNVAGLEQRSRFICGSVYYVDIDANIDRLRDDIYRGALILSSNRNTVDEMRVPFSSSETMRKEREMLQLFYCGLGVRQISMVMGVSDKTLYGWAGAITKRLNMKNLIQLRHSLQKFGPDYIHLISR